MLLLAVAATAAGCGDELLGEEVGCEWFEGHNCWKASLEAAQPCTHENEDKGTLAADGTRCTFSDGTEIGFANPLDLNDEEEIKTHLWDFEIVKEGSLCMSFSEPSLAKRILVTSLGTYTEQTKNIGLQITCPDEKKYKVSNTSVLSSCDDFKEILPGIKIDWSDTAIIFRLTGGTQGDFHIFSCEME